MDDEEVSSKKTQFDGARTLSGVVRIQANSRRLVATLALIAVAAGLGLAALDQHRPAEWLWSATTAMLLVPLGWSVLSSLVRRDVGVDAIALVSMAVLEVTVRVVAVHLRGRRAAALQPATPVPAAALA